MKISLPFGEVLVESKSFAGNQYRRIWSLVDDRPDTELAYLNKSWDMSGNDLVWAKTRIRLSSGDLFVDTVDDFIALVQLAKVQAVAMDKEFVPGEKITVQ